ncbi:MAG: iron-containing alcohol dehydrogenase [Verrucomicrobia bacterium]|jgi:alcohol dehydrogenase class IV|nr:iron-containing alcohol dehydrogenase [Verrucomicrobiota bacterium]
MSTVAAFSFPTSVRYGAGVLREIRNELEDLEIRRPLVVCDKFLPDTPAFGLLDDVLREIPNLEQPTLFRDVHPNPVEADVVGAAQAYREAQCDGIIGLGGGSALDVAKVCRLIIQCPDFQLDDSDRLQREKWDLLPPFIAIPTTAGTGSEVGRSSVVTLKSTGAKSVIFHANLLADLVILDPKITVSLPPKLTAATGLDALTHCIESFTSPVIQPLCDGIALEGIQLIAKHIVTSVQDGTNLEARGGMQLAAMMGGIAFQKDLGATHSMAHPLSSLCGLHHGLANALCLPAVMRWNADKKPGLYRRIGISAGLNLFEASDQVADNATITWVNKLLSDSGIQMGLSNHGVTKDHIEPLSQLAIKDSCHLTNPVSMLQEDFLKLYQTAL